MKRHSDSSIIPKIIKILVAILILGIILLFFRPRDEVGRKKVAPCTPEKVFTQVIEASRPRILEIWQDGDKFISKPNFNCPKELQFSKEVGSSYYECQPHFWQCYWQGGVIEHPEIETKLFGQTYHLRAKPSFTPIEEFSEEPRYYKTVKMPGFKIKYGYLIEFEVREIPGISQHMILPDVCRDTYLPQRIYGYGSGNDLKGSEGFIWDNFDRNLFLDKFYVSNQRVNEWRLLTGKNEKVIKNPSQWPLPALLNQKEQKQYCSFFGKRLMEAKLFDASFMIPGDQLNHLPAKVLRPQTPWQRDIGKTFLGMSRINEDYQLTPLDCQLAQVEGCPEKRFTTDSSGWVGINHGLGFYPEALVNDIEPEKNLKLSSKLLPASSPWHELGLRSSWKGEQESSLPVAFRCYEEVVK